MAPGLGLLKGVVVDSHFAERGRLGRLLGAVAQNPRNVGVGIDEDTAIVVERAGGRTESREGIDRICDLRVEDHPEPIVELRRLVGIWSGWDLRRRAHAQYERGDPGGAGG